MSNIGCTCIHKEASACQHSTEQECLCACHQMLSAWPIKAVDPLEDAGRMRNLLFSLANYVRVNVLPLRNDPVLQAIVAEAERTAKRGQN